MGPRRDDAAEDEDAGEVDVGGPGPGAGVVDDVLDGGEAEGGEGRVDDPVDDAVELAAPEIEHPEEREALEELLDDGRAHRRADGLGGEGGDDAVDGRREAARAEGAPGEDEREGPRGLRVVPVEQAGDGHVDEHRGEGERGAVGHGRVGADGVADRRAAGPGRRRGAAARRGGSRGRRARGRPCGGRAPGSMAAGRTIGRGADDTSTGSRVGSAWRWDRRPRMAIRSPTP